MVLQKETDRFEDTEESGSPSQTREGKGHGAVPAGGTTDRLECTTAPTMMVKDE